MKYLLIIFIIFFTSYFRADHSISGNCHNVLSNFENIPSDGMVLITLIESPFAGTSASFGSAALVPALSGPVASIAFSNEIETYDASVRLCFPDVLTDLKSNTNGIADNQGLIGNLQQAVGTNVNNISANTASVVANTNNISTNTLAVSSNTNGIADNQGLIGNLQQAVGTNVNNISANTSTISSNNSVNLMQFKKLSSGVASSIAISNVDYADEGWSMGVGAGNFNSETEYAFGLSFASENTSFKIATSKDSSALGINYKFGR